MKLRFIAVVGLGAATIFILVQARRLRANVSTLEREIAELKEHEGRPDRVMLIPTPIVDSRRRDPRPPAALAGAPEPADDQPAEEGDQASSSKTRPAPTPQQQVSAVDHAYQQQTRDQGWANQSEPVIRANLKDIAGDKSVIDSIECRESLCKASVIHHGEDGFFSFSNGVMGKMKWQGANMFMRGKDLPSGDIESVMFFAKADMPQPETSQPQ
jgi:hypothetical protein